MKNGKWKMTNSSHGPHLRVERVAKTVTQKVEREERQRHRHTGEDQLPGKDRDVLNAVRRQAAPRSERRLHAEPEEREKCSRQHDLRNSQRGVDDHRS